MKPLYAVLGAVVAVAIGYYAFFYNPCKEPTDMKIALTGLQCTIDILNKPVEQIRAEACKYLGRDAECEFSEDDKLVILEMINKQAFACTKERLAKENLCTDKVDEIAKSKGL